MRCCFGSFFSGSFSTSLLALLRSSWPHGHAIYVTNLGFLSSSVVSVFLFMKFPSSLHRDRWSCTGNVCFAVNLLWTVIIGMLTPDSRREFLICGAVVLGSIHYPNCLSYQVVQECWSLIPACLAILLYYGENALISCGGLPWLTSVFIFSKLVSSPVSWFC